MDIVELVALVGDREITTEGLSPTDIVFRLEESRKFILSVLEDYEVSAQQARESFLPEILPGELHPIAERAIARVNGTHALLEQAKQKADNLAEEIKPTPAKVDPVLVVEARSILRSLDQIDRVTAWFEAIAVGDVTTRHAFETARPYDPVRLAPATEREGLEKMLEETEPVRVARLRAIRRGIEIVERVAAAVVGKIASDAKLSQDEQRFVKL